MIAMKKAKNKPFPNYLNSLSEDERLSIVSLAHHEAGHAVFCWRNGFSLGRFGVSMNPHDRVGLCTQGRFVGWQEHAPVCEYFRDNCQFNHIHLEFLISGPAAEDRFLRSISRPIRAFRNSWADYDAARHIVEKEWFDADPDKRLREEYCRVTRLLGYPSTWRAVEAVAKGLLKYHYMNCERTFSIIDRVNPPKRRVDCLDEMGYGA
jgi:hypothetical protein